MAVELVANATASFIGVVGTGRRTPTYPDTDAPAIRRCLGEDRQQQPFFSIFHGVQVNIRHHPCRSKIKELILTTGDDEKGYPHRQQDFNIEKDFHCQFCFNFEKLESIGADPKAAVVSDKCHHAIFHRPSGLRILVGPFAVDNQPRFHR